MQTVGVSGQVRSVQEINLLGFNAAVGVAIGCLAVVRLLQGEHYFAALNVVISGSCLASFVRVWFYRDVRYSGTLISVVLVIGSSTAVFMGGMEQFFWIYPGYLAAFFLSNARTATVLCCLGLSVLVPYVWSITDALVFTRTMLSFGVTLSFGLTFLVANNLHRKELERLTKTDALTGIGNRRALNDVIQRLVTNPKENAEVGVFMIDLDYFKKVNDLFGHEQGDRVLIELTQAIELYVEGKADVYRYGGEEFTVIARGEKASVVALAECLRSYVESLEILPKHTITISVGVALLHANEDVRSVLLRADAALLRAKENGRNQLVVDNP